MSEEKKQRKRIKINHPNSWSDGRIYLYRIQAANALGKPLPPKVVIHHHIDDTLIICEDENYHRFLHVRTKAFFHSGNAHKRRCIYCRQWDFIDNLHKDQFKFWHKKCRKFYDKKRRGGI